MQKASLRVTASSPNPCLTATAPPPPELRIENPDYLSEIRDAVAELRTLNSLLKRSRRQPQKASRAVLNLAKHFDTFLNGYSKSLGKGTGYLTIGLIASLLYQAGIGQDV